MQNTSMGGPRAEDRVDLTNLLGTFPSHSASLVESLAWITAQ